MASVLCARSLCFNKLYYPEQSVLKLAIVSFGTSCILHLDHKWRIQRKLPANPNTSGVLTDKPDYSYLDGRPAEIGLGMKRRMEKNREYAKKILTLTKEIDFAVERHKALEQEKEQKRQRKLDSKLKRKGHLLLQTK